MLDKLFPSWPRKHELYVPGMYAHEIDPMFLCKHCAESFVDNYEYVSRLPFYDAECHKGPRMGFIEMLAGRLDCTVGMRREQREWEAHIMRTPQQVLMRSAKLLMEAGDAEG